MRAVWNRIVFKSILCCCVVLFSCATKLDKDDYLVSSKALFFEDAQNFYFTDRIDPVDNSLEKSHKKWTLLMADHLLQKSGYNYQSYGKTSAISYLSQVIEIALNRQLSGVSDESDFCLKEITTVFQKEKLKEIIYFSSLDKNFWERILSYIQPENGGKLIAIQNDLWRYILVNWELANESAAYQIAANQEKVSYYLDIVSANIQKIEFNLESAPSALFLFEKNSQPYSLAVTNGTTPIANVPIAIYWKDPREKKSGWVTKYIYSDLDGKVGLQMPIIYSRESARVVFEIRQGDFKISSKITDEEVRQKFSDFLKVVESKKFVATPTVLSNAKNKPTAVTIMQFDRSGFLLSDEAVSTSACISAMREDGFNFFDLNLKDRYAFDEKEITSSTTPREVLNKIPLSLLANSEWQLIGLVSLTSFDLINGIYEGSASGQIVLYDKVGNIIYQNSITASGRGNNAETVLNLIWRSVGRNIKRELAKALL